MGGPAWNFGGSLTYPCHGSDLQFSYIIVSLSTNDFETPRVTHDTKHEWQETQNASDMWHTAQVAQLNNASDHVCFILVF